MKKILTIAGTDPSGAAGLQVDLQVIRDHGGHGLSVVTAVIAQNTSGVGQWVAVEPSLVAAQLDAVFSDIEVDAVKIGMVPTSAVAETIAEALHGRVCPIVQDPVLASGDGATALVREGTVETLLARLFPRTSLITPNAIEAAVLLGYPPDEEHSIEAMAEALCARGAAPAVLVKGGHADTGDQVYDALATDGDVWKLNPYRRVPRDVRGTGCQLTTAIACNLADGLALFDAVEAARAYLASLLKKRSRRLGKGRWVIQRERPE